MCVCVCVYLAGSILCKLNERLQAGSLPELRGSLRGLPLIPCCLWGIARAAVKNCSVRAFALFSVLVFIAQHRSAEGPLF